MHTIPGVFSRYAVLLGGIMLSGGASALECGDFTFPKCSAPEFQYAGGFDPGTGFGGFGGGECKAVRTPVVFIHGNADRAISWDSPVQGSVAGYAPPRRSVYEEFKEQGYNDCELFGVTYLSAEEQENPQDNFHRRGKYEIIGKFIDAVRAYTGSATVDLVTHSLGVSMAIATLEASDAWAGIRRFVNIAGGIRGLNSCLYVGPANPAVATCGSQNIFDTYVFGFYPYYNRWTGATDEHSLRFIPRRYRQVLFYTLHAGIHDQVHCSTAKGFSDCARGALFAAGPNVRAQLDVGAGSTAGRVDFDFNRLFPDPAQSVKVNTMGGDIDGIGHFKARNDTGAIIVTMLNGDCKKIACQGPYRGGPVRAK
ncbi:MAG: extracellular native short-chain-length polyhydroxyalkanoate depolymerase PhaZ7 [Gammaproteobacteria bacterium]